MLHILEERSFTEIGAMLDEKPDTCRKRLARVLARITRQMDPVLDQ